MMSGESSSASKYFTKNFQGNNVDYDTTKAGLHAYIGDFAGKGETEIAQKIKEYCQKNEIKLKTNKQNSSNKSTHTTRSSSSASGNVTINKGLSVWDYLLLYNLFGNKTTIINNPPAAAYSTPPQEKKDKSKEGNANGAIFLVALCVITHLVVCVIYHEYFKKEAEKPGKSINYLANCQLGLAIFQLAFGLASLVAAGVFLDQSEIFFPLLINTFICLGSAYLFYRERNNTLNTEVKPYMELAKLLINDECKENLQRERQHKENTSFNQSFAHSSASSSEATHTYPQGSSHPGTTYSEPPPPYSPHPSAPPAYDNQSRVGDSGNLPGKMSYAQVTGGQRPERS